MDEGRFQFIKLLWVTETEGQLGAEEVRERRISTDLGFTSSMKPWFPEISVNFPGRLCSNPLH